MATNRPRLDKLNIAQWNIQGLRSKYQELRTILNEENIQVACLQETLLGDTEWQPSKQFKLEKSPHFGGNNNRGVALMLHSALQYSRINLRTTLEVVAVTIHNGKEFTIGSIYLSPNVNVPKEDLRTVIQQLPRPFLLLGDYNAKHPSWDLINPVDLRGKLIENLLMEVLSSPE